MKYIIKKLIDAPTLQDALKNEKNAEIVDITKDDTPEPPPMGFRA